MSNTILKELKGLINDFVEDGAILESSKNPRYRNLDEGRTRFIRVLIELLLKTDFLKDETKTYISDKYITLRRVAEKHKKNKNTVQSQIWRDSLKIQSIFKDKKVIINVLEYRNLDITEYEKALAEALIKNAKNDYLVDNIALELPETSLITDIEDSRLNSLIETILPYHKRRIKAIEQNIDKEALGYLRYILNCETLLNEKDLQRRKKIIELLR